MSEPRKTVGRAIGWSAIEAWGAAVLTIIVSIVLARLLEPRAFGLVAMATVYVNVVTIFVDQGLGSALVQRKALDRLHLDTAFWIAVLGGVLLCGISMLAAPQVAALFGEAKLVPVVRWLSLGLVINAFTGTQRAILQRELAFQDLAIRTLIGAVAGGVVGVGAALQGFGVWSLVAQTLTASAVGTVVLWRVSEWRPAFRMSMKHFRDLAGFSASILGSNLLSVVNRRSDDFLIGVFLGPVALGYYTVAYTLLRNLTSLLAGATTRVAFPAFSRLQHDLPRMRKGFYTATKYTSLIAFPAFIGLILVAPEFIRGVYGPKWVPSVPVMQVLALIGILHSVFYFNATVMNAAGKASWQFGLSLLNAVTNLIAFAIAVRWGIVAVAAAYVLRGYLLSPLTLWLLRRLISIDFRTYFRQYLVPAAGSAAMAAVILVLKRVVGGSLGPVVELILYTTVGAGSYALFVHLRAPHLWHDLMRMTRRSMPDSANLAPTNPS